MLPINSLGDLFYFRTNYIRDFNLKDTTICFQK